MAYVIAIGNEKGGSGKSTTSMHIFAAFAHSGYKVGAIDLDLRQKSFFRYVEYREATAKAKKINLPMPITYTLSASANDSKDAAKSEEENEFAKALNALDKHCDVILIDCPGSDTYYARMAHAAADMLITPMNDSFIDFDMLARVDGQTGKILGPSVYAEMVWEARQLRGKAGLKPTDWIVVRNRISTIEAKNRRRVSEKLNEFSKRIGFRVVPGFSERVIFRELFTQGLTLLDLPILGKSYFSMSNVAARQEMRDLISALKFSDFKFDI